MSNKQTHTEHEDFFDYLASINIDKVEQQDVEDINSRIDKRIEYHYIKRYNNLLSIVFLVVFTAGLTFLIFHKKEVIQVGPQPITTVTKPKDIIHEAQTNDSAVLNEKTLLAEESTKTKKGNKEHFEIPEVTERLSESILIEEMQILETPLRDTIQEKRIKQEEQQLLKALPNASIIYIYDLKVTEYQKLYFKKLKPFPISSTGISAQFEDKDDLNNFISDRSQTPSYTLDMLLKDALKNFKQGNFKLGSSLFNELLSYNSNDPNALFYQGLCKYNTGNFNKAAQNFDRILNLDNNVFHQEAEWYKALSLLEAGKKSEGIELLIKINNQKGFYAKQAGEKLKTVVKN